MRHRGGAEPLGQTLVKTLILLQTRESPVLFPEYFGPGSGLPEAMALIGRLHPLLVHFPIALVLVAVAGDFGGLLVWGPDFFRS